MSDAAQQALGAKMDRAMRLQQGGQAPAAALLYREVLAAAPGTHDALHMLGVTEMMACRPPDDEWLIRDTLSLRRFELLSDADYERLADLERQAIALGYPTVA